jgi:hypothetical protein
MHLIFYPYLILFCFFTFPFLMNFNFYIIKKSHFKNFSRLTHLGNAALDSSFVCVRRCDPSEHVFPLFPFLLPPHHFSTKPWAIDYPWAAFLELTSLTSVLDPIRGGRLKNRLSFLPSKICFGPRCLLIDQGSPVPT